MKRVLVIMLVGLLAISAFADEENPGPAATAESGAAPTAEVKEAPATPSAEAKVDAARPAAEIETDDQRFSYIVGARFGENVKRHPANIDYSALVQGIYDGMNDRELLMSEKAVEEFLEKYQVKLEERFTEKLEAMAETNLKAGKEFLEKNAKQEGVVATKSGLQYRVLKDGDGAKPGPTSTVKVNYVGKLLDGKVFDSSYKRGEPIEFSLGGVIAGWTEGLQLMPVGSKYEFFIPSELAYKEQGSPPVIEPNSTLIFEVELLEIVGGEAEGEN